MTTRAEIVAEARTWIGTPWRHQAHIKGVGCDCGGLVRGVMVACGLMPADPRAWPGAAEFDGYARRPDGQSFVRACDRFLVRIDAAQAVPGDVAVMRFAGDPQHVAFLAPYVYGGLALVHSLLAERRVVEHRLDAVWASRVVAYYSLPGVDAS
jgi:NlpC/P60 family putative phage cell wall peptidase